MRDNRCAARCCDHDHVDRRQFLAAASLASAAAIGGNWAWGAEALPEKITPHGPASKCTPQIKACFVRRKGDYGLRWPGAIYDGEAARKQYTEKLQAAEQQLRCKIEIRPEPIYSPEEADAWLAECQAATADGLLVVLLDRQEHAWPTAAKAIESKIQTVVFSPVGSSFTTNTAPLAQAPGSFIASTDDFSQVEYGLKMLCAATKLRAARCVVLQGKERKDVAMPLLGMQLRYVPAKEFLDEYQKTPVDDRVRAMAAEYMKRARRVFQATEQDVINGLKSYLVAGQILQREEADAITMDCLGALGKTDVSLPCIAWSRMNDDGIPAACEADLGAVATHAIVEYLFDRPGFQQDPVAETARGAIIGAHCSCPTRLNGFDQEPEPFDIQHHHAMRDAVPRTIWREGQRVTCADVLMSGVQPVQMLISAGDVIGNVAVPPAGGCVVSVMAKFDNVEDVLAFPGFHQLFFYGDYKRQLKQFCQLIGLEATVV
ncbi:MAG TPA: hypothetical protein PLF81_25890 [Candidatus Anammoximicrobium sp.]|nr:hypothetical protein [Candidatus Anammoximicrobium sp.]